MAKAKPASIDGTKPLDNIREDIEVRESAGYVLWTLAADPEAKEGDPSPKNPAIFKYLGKPPNRLDLVAVTDPKAGVVPPDGESLALVTTIFVSGKLTQVAAFREA